MRGVHRTWASLATVMDLRGSARSFLMMMHAFLKTASFLRRMRARLFWMLGSFNGGYEGRPSEALGKMPRGGSGRNDLSGYRDNTIHLYATVMKRLYAGLACTQEMHGRGVNDLWLITHGRHCSS
ncbi:hypothetical protein MRX96_031404 [Rhipicephalus microplus]